MTCIDVEECMLCLWRGWRSGGSNSILPFLLVAVLFVCGIVALTSLTFVTCGGMVAAYR